MMIKKIEEYFKDEYESLIGVPDKDAKWYAVQRCLGVVEFVKMTNPEMSFVEIDLMCEYYKEKIMAG